MRRSTYILAGLAGMMGAALLLAAAILGHALVIPKAKARNILDAEPEVVAELMKAAQVVAKASKQAFGADGVTIQQFNESAGGQVVFHLHVHLVPRTAGSPMKPPASIKEEPAVLSDQALKLAAALKAQG